MTRARARSWLIAPEGAGLRLTSDASSARRRRSKRDARWLCHKGEVHLSTESEPAGGTPACFWPADRVERWPIERLIPYANNPRVHSEADLDKIAAAIRTWGWTNPVLVDEEGVLIAGHARVGAAARLGLADVPVIIARGWSEEDRKSTRLNSSHRSLPRMPSSA